MSEIEVLFVDDGGEVWCVGPAVGLGGDVEGRLGVFGVTLEEELEECVDVDACCGRGADGRSVRGIGVADVDGLREGCIMRLRQFYKWMDK